MIYLIVTFFGFESRALHFLGKYFTTELYTQFSLNFSNCLVYVLCHSWEIFRYYFSHSFTPVLVFFFGTMTSMLRIFLSLFPRSLSFCYFFLPGLSLLPISSILDNFYLCISKFTDVLLSLPLFHWSHLECLFVLTHLFGSFTASTSLLRLSIFH